MRTAIDTSFDFRTDAFGKDPDAYSATLRRYHKLLWSKPLPSGALFDLDDTTLGVYLHHLSDLGEFFLSSDSVIPTFTRWTAMKPITAQFPEAENEAFRTIGYTVGGMILWPGNQVAGKMTINGARGFDRRIADRMDLTLECIRYQGQRSPLGDVLARYSDFFALFADFRGYVGGGQVDAPDVGPHRAIGGSSGTRRVISVVNGAARATTAATTLPCW